MSDVLKVAWHCDQCIHEWDLSPSAALGRSGSVRNSAKRAVCFAVGSEWLSSSSSPRSVKETVQLISRVPTSSMLTEVTRQPPNQTGSSGFFCPPSRSEIAKEEQHLKLFEEESG